MEQISIDQQARVRLAVTDRAGNPAQIQGAPAWASTNDAVMTVTPDAADPMTALCVPADGAADQLADVTATVDADLGDGVRPLIGVLTFAITGGAAQFVELSATVEDKPAA